MAVDVSPKEQEQIRFAKSIVDRLETGRVENAFERLIVVASPEFLGQLRVNFSTSLKSLLSLEIDKDYVSLRAEELRARLPDRL